MNTISVSGLIFFMATLIVVVAVTILIIHVLTEIDDAKHELPILSDGEMSFWHQKIKHGEKDPFLVLAVCHYILERLPAVYHQTHPTELHIRLSSGYYGQVTFLLARRKYLFAAAFLLLHWWHAVVANIVALRTKKKWNLSELEVLSSGIFMVSNTVPWLKPVLGLIPLHLLKLGVRRATIHDSPITVAFALSKCYALTRRMKYLDAIKVLDLGRDSDQGDMLQIAKNLGLSLEGFYVILNC